MTGLCHSPGQYVHIPTDPAPQQMLWFRLGLRQEFVLVWAGTNRNLIFKPALSAFSIDSFFLARILVTVMNL